MNDFITMSCPSCGGKLSIAPNTPTLVCQHCGTEHMLRWEAGTVLLESFARCPQCKRNDKVQKISAIVTGQSNTLLAQKLLPPAKPLSPPQPKPPMESEKLKQLTASIIVISFSLLALIVWRISSGTGIAGILACCFGAFTIPMIILILPELKSQEKRKMEYRNWKQDLQDHEKVVENWGLLLQLWNQLYYCARDDCVFIQNESRFAPSSHMIEYINWLRSHTKAE